MATTSTSSSTTTTTTTSTASTSSSSSSTTSTTTTSPGQIYLRCSTAVRDLTSQVTTLSYTNDSTETMVCQIVVYLGDGANDLDGTGGSFEHTIMFGSQTNMPDPQLIYYSTATRASVFTEQFVLPVNETVTTKIKSPNAADTSVWCHACIYEVGVESIRDELALISKWTRGKTTVEDDTGTSDSPPSGVYPETGEPGGGIYPDSGGSSGRGVYVGKC